MPFYDEGNYKVEVTEHGLGENYRGGSNDYVYIRFIVKETEDGKAVTKEYHRQWDKAITEKTIPYLANDFKALGINVSSFLKLDPNVTGGVNLVGKALTLTCKHSPDGKYDNWEPPFGGGALKEVKKLPKDKYAELHKKYGTAFAAAIADDQPY